MSPVYFVFGSNLAGVHGAGAARYAVEHHGAIMGRGIGFQGTSYAIPTKDERIQTLPLDLVQGHVSAFLRIARQMPETAFHVTQIGCGLAGFTAEQIAPLFAKAPMNCKFSTAWSKWLPDHETWTGA